MRSLSASLPERKRTYRFALTPLADAMFQLLIFFMLSTSLTPYSLITLRTGDTAPEAQAEGGGEGPASAPATSTSRITIWNLGNGTVTVSGQTYETDQLTDLAQAVGSQDDPGTLVLIVGPTARVQDIASAMEALESADVTAVQITNEGG